MNRLMRCLPLLAALPAVGCVLVQPLDKAAEDSSAAGSSSSSAGAKGSAGASSGSSGATGSAGRGSAGSGAGGAPAVGKARFIGSWIAADGMLTFSCPGVPEQNNDITGSVQTWEAGTTSDLLEQKFEGNCPLRANVAGTIASAVAGQTCVENSTDTSSGDAITQTFAFTSYRFVINAAGDTATESFSGNDVYEDKTTGGSLNCTFARMGSYTKQ